MFRTKEEADSRFQTVVHEFTHLIFDNEDYEYGFRDCLQLAKTSPFKAKGNADNWGYIVEEFRYRRLVQATRSARRSAAAEDSLESRESIRLKPARRFPTSMFFVLIVKSSIATILIVT
jgi:hypothetical protein